MIKITIKDDYDRDDDCEENDEVFIYRCAPRKTALWSVGGDILNHAGDREYEEYEDDGGDCDEEYEDHGDGHDESGGD